MKGYDREPCRVQRGFTILEWRFSWKYVRKPVMESVDFLTTEWDESPAGFERLMESLFINTPPTALIVDETCLFIAALGFLVRRGLRVPEQVSLVAGDGVPILDMCWPRFTQMRWDNPLIVRRVVRWVDAVRKGNPDRKILNIPASFVPGGSIGPVRRD